eukprot:1395579-Rhodomonas_salina.1
MLPKTKSLAMCFGCDTCGHSGFDFFAYRGVVSRHAKKKQSDHLCERKQQNFKTRCDVTSGAVT